MFKKLWQKIAYDSEEQRKAYNLVYSFIELSPVEKWEKLEGRYLENEERMSFSGCPFVISAIYDNRSKRGPVVVLKIINKENGHVLNFRGWQDQTLQTLFNAVLRLRAKKIKDAEIPDEQRFKEFIEYANKYEQ